MNVGSSTDAPASVVSECDLPVDDVEDSDTSNRADSSCSAATRRLFGVPVTTSNAQAAGGRCRARISLWRSRFGHRHVGCRRSVGGERDRRLVREEPRISPAASPWYATSVFSPLGVVSLDLSQLGPRHYDLLRLETET